MAQSATVGSEFGFSLVMLGIGGLLCGDRDSSPIVRLQCFDIQGPYSSCKKVPRVASSAIICRQNVLAHRGPTSMECFRKLRRIRTLDGFSPAYPADTRRFPWTKCIFTRQIGNASACRATMVRTAKFVWDSAPNWSFRRGNWSMYLLIREDRIFQAESCACGERAAGFRAIAEYE